MQSQHISETSGKFLVTTFVNGLYHNGKGIKVVRE